MNTLKDKTVVITGAASGIGLALAAECARHGARLLLADLQPERLEAARAGFSAGGARCAALVIDVADSAALAELAAFAIEHFGGADVVINNAGVGLVAPVESLDPADAHWLMNINFWGVVNGCRVFLPQLRERPEALLVNISSIFAMISVPTQSMYNASKAAVRAFSDALRGELAGTRVGVLCVHPGGIRTSIVDASRLRDISMVAESPEWLRSNFRAQARTSPDEAARVIVKAILDGRTRVLVGADAHVMDALFRLAPARASAWVVALLRRMRRRLVARRAAGKRL